MGKSKRTTMNDIAEKAGVSQATVSFVLNNRTNSGVKISESTKQKVLDAAEKLNYSLNDAAKALVTGRFSSIQLFISDITDPFFGEFIYGVEKVAIDKGYKILLRSTEFSKNLEKKSFSALSSSMVDGVIVCGTQLLEGERESLANNHRIIYIGEKSSKYGGNINVNDTAGYLEAVQNLYAIGKKRFLVVVGPESRPTSIKRINCLLDAIKSLNPSVDMIQTIHSESVSLEVSESIINQIISFIPDTDVIFCFNDIMAIGIIKKLQQRGIVIPNDVGIIGFDGISMGKMVTPALSTISVPRFELGKKAMSLIVDMIENNLSDPYETLNTNFIPRESH